MLHLRGGGEIVAQVGGHILRLDRGRHHVKHIEMLAQPGVFDEITGRAGAAAAHQISGIGRACARLKGQPAQFQHHIACGVARMAMDFARRAGQGCGDNLAPDIDHIIHHTRACGGVDLARLRQQHAHPQLFQGAQGGFVHIGRLVIGKDRHQRKGVAQLAIGGAARGLIGAGAMARATPAPLAPGGGGFGGGAHARMAFPVGS